MENIYHDHVAQLRHLSRTVIRLSEENSRLRAMLDAIVDGETTDRDWECVPGTALDAYRKYRDNV